MGSFHRSPLIVFVLALFAVLACGASANAASSKNSARHPSKAQSGVQGKAFFIGNSYTYVNDLPAVVEGLVNSRMGRNAQPSFSVDSYTRGAASLTEFLDSPRDAQCREKLEKGGFRWVVLQDQSQAPMLMPEMTMRGGRGWAEIAKNGGAKPILFITWEHAIIGTDGKFSSTPRMQDKLTATYCRLALEIGADVAPVGEAWRLWREQYPETPLYSSDGSHPNALGTYMAACVFYAVITGQSPVGLPNRVMHNGRLVLEVPADKAKQCQKVAWKVVRGFSPSGFLEQLERQEAGRPTLEEIRPMLVSGLTVRALQQRLGKPATVYVMGGQTFHHFLLRGDMELQAICTKSGEVENITIIRTNGMSEIITLKK